MRGPFWTPITPPTGPLLHAGPQSLGRVDPRLDILNPKGHALIGTYRDAIEQIENLKSLSNGDYVIPHFKQTNLRFRPSEPAMRTIRDGLAAAQQDAIGAFAAKHAKS